MKGEKRNDRERRKRNDKGKCQRRTYLPSHSRDRKLDEASSSCNSFLFFSCEYILFRNLIIRRACVYYIHSTSPRFLSGKKTTANSDESKS